MENAALSYGIGIFLLLVVLWHVFTGRYVIHYRYSHTTEEVDFEKQPEFFCFLVGVLAYVSCHFFATPHQFLPELLGTLDFLHIGLGGVTMSIPVYFLTKFVRIKPDPANQFDFDEATLSAWKNQGG